MCKNDKLLWLSKTHEPSLYPSTRHCFHTSCAFISLHRKKRFKVYFPPYPETKISSSKAHIKLFVFDDLSTLVAKLSGLFPYISYIGMYRCERYGFQAV